MDQLIGPSGLGGPVCVIVLTVIYLVRLVVVRLTDPKRIIASSQARTVKHLLEMVKQIEDNGAELTGKDTAVIDLEKTAIKGLPGKENEPTPDDRPWWIRWVWWKRSNG